MSHHPSIFALVKLRPPYLLILGSGTNPFFGLPSRSLAADAYFYRLSKKGMGVHVLRVMMVLLAALGWGRLYAQTTDGISQ